MRIAQLIWTDRKGAGHLEQGEVSRLAKKLETLRASADLWLLDEEGEKTEIIGGCERNDGRADDKRLKWVWWYDKNMAQQKLERESQSSKHCDAGWMNDARFGTEGE